MIEQLENENKLLLLQLNHLLDELEFYHDECEKLQNDSGRLADNFRPGNSNISITPSSTILLERLAHIQRASSLHTSGGTRIERSTAYRDLLNHQFSLLVEVKKQSESRRKAEKDLQSEKELVNELSTRNTTLTQNVTDLKSDLEHSERNCDEKEKQLASCDADLEDLRQRYSALTRREQVLSQTVIELHDTLQKMAKFCANLKDNHPELINEGWD